MLSMHERRKSVSSASVIWYTVLFRQFRTDRPIAHQLTKRGGRVARVVVETFLFMIGYSYTKR